MSKNCIQCVKNVRTGLDLLCDECRAVRVSRSPTTHDLKTWPEFFEAIADGRKPFEIRKDDRNFRVGDTLRLLEFVPCDICNGTGRMRDNGGFIECDCMVTPHPTGRHTGRMKVRTVTYKTNFGQPSGQVVLGLSENSTLSEPSA